MKVCLATFYNNLGFHGPITTGYKDPNTPAAEPEKSKLKWELYPTKAVPGVKGLTAAEGVLFKEDLKRFNNKRNRFKAYLPFLTENVLYNCWSWSGPFFNLTWSNCETSRLSDGTAQDVRVKLHLGKKPSDYTKFPSRYRKNIISTGSGGTSGIQSRECTEDNAEKIIGAQVLIKIGAHLIIFEGKIKICVGANYTSSKYYGDHVGIGWNLESGCFQSEKIVSKDIIDELQETIYLAGTRTRSNPKVRVAVVGLFDDDEPQQIFANDASELAKSNWKIFTDGCGADMIIVSSDQRITTCHKNHVYRNAPKLKELLTTSPDRDHILKLDLTEEHVEALLLYQYSCCTQLILEDDETSLCILEFAEKYEMWDMWKDTVTGLLQKDTTFFGRGFVDDFNTFLTRCTKRNEATTKKLKRTVEERIDFLKNNPYKVIRKKRPVTDMPGPKKQKPKPALRIIELPDGKRRMFKRFTFFDGLQDIQIGTSNNDALRVDEQPTKSIREEKGTKKCKAVVGPEPEKQMQEPAKRNPEEGQDEPLEHQHEPEERQREPEEPQHEPEERQHEPEGRQQAPAKRRHNPMIRRVKRKRLTAKRKPSKRQHSKPDASWTEALQCGEQSNKFLWKDVINKNCQVEIGPTDLVKASGLNKIEISPEFKVEKVEPNESEEHQELLDDVNYFES